MSKKEVVPIGAITLKHKLHHKAKNRERAGNCCMLWLCNSLLNLVTSNVCASCDINDIADSGLCRDCWKGLEFITSSKSCKLCGAHSIYDICGKCSGKKNKYIDAIYSTVYLNEISKNLIYALKYKGRRYIANIIAKMMAQVANKIINDCGIITSVPMHSYKMIKRGFNQSDLIAHYLAKLLNRDDDFNCNIIAKIINTDPQKNLTKAQRKTNLNDAFMVTRDVKNQNILLVDDVVTTGITSTMCAKALKASGAAKIYVLTFANVGSYK